MTQDPSFLAASDAAISEFSARRLAATGDPLADAVALRIDRSKPANMLAEVHYLAKSAIGVFQEFVDQLYSVPHWVDWEQIETARRIQSSFHHVRSIAILTGSLLQGYRGDQALLWMVRRGYLNHEVVRRIHEANRIVHSVNQEYGLKPGAHSHRVLSEVRLANAMLRKSMLSRGWQQQQQNQPYNQLDMAFQMLQFGHLALLNMERLGVLLKHDDRQAIQHYWRYCSHIFGVDQRLQTQNLEQQQRLFHQLSSERTELCSEHQQLTRATLEGLTHQRALNLPLELIQQLARLSLGEATAEALGLAFHPRWQRAAKLYVTANRGATFAHYHIPGMSSLNSRFNRLVAGNLLGAPQGNKAKTQHTRPGWEKIA